MLRTKQLANTPTLYCILILSGLFKVIFAKFLSGLVCRQFLLRRGMAGVEMKGVMILESVYLLLQQMQRKMRNFPKIRRFREQNRILIRTGDLSVFCVFQRFIREILWTFNYAAVSDCSFVLVRDKHDRRLKLIFFGDICRWIYSCSNLLEKRLFLKTLWRSLPTLFVHRQQLRE